MPKLTKPQFDSHWNGQTGACASCNAIFDDISDGHHLLIKDDPVFKDVESLVCISCLRAIKLMVEFGHDCKSVRQYLKRR
jgi:hypothetical protein